MRETRLKMGKVLHERGESNHPYAVEYLESLSAQIEEPSPRRKAKSKVTKRAR